MAERARRLLRGLGTLVVAMIVIGGGFASGLVVGVIGDEPSLLLGHLRGRSEQVPWRTEGAAAGTPSIPSVSAPPPTESTPEIGFAVQVGAFANADAADEIAGRLRGRGFSVYVSPSAAGRKERWRVRVGPVASRGEADSLALQLKKSQGLPTWVLRVDEI